MKIKRKKNTIKALPASYSIIGTSIDLVPEDQGTVDYFKYKIKEQSMNSSAGE